MTQNEFLDDYRNMLILLIYFLGFILSLTSLFQSRTPQGAMAWILSLILIPFISIPLYLLFGKKKIRDYPLFDPEVFRIRNVIVNSFSQPFDESLLFQVYNIQLLLDGDETFEEMIATIQEAKHFILLQMYIFRTDSMGTIFAETLMKKAQEGVKVYLLYERLGIKRSRKLLKRMKKSGIILGEFSPTKLNKLQLNFRNHRKLLLIDGEFGFWGGINIGDEYLGISRRFSIPKKKQRNWRDTNIKITGPLVKKAILDFIRDWNFSHKNKTSFDLFFKQHLFDQTRKISSQVCLENTGPYESISSNLYQHIKLFNRAKFRLWIANPYVVPPQALVDSIILAKMRGVDICLIVPDYSDNILVSWAMEVYLEKFVSFGINVFKFQKGMMHQKVILVDDELAMIGSSNLDYRSMHINFENNIVIKDPQFLLSLELALRQDMMDSKMIHFWYYNELPFYKKIKNYLCNSLAPIL